MFYNLYFISKKKKTSLIKTNFFKHNRFNTPLFFKTHKQTSSFLKKFNFLKPYFFQNNEDFYINTFVSNKVIFITNNQKPLYRIKFFNKNVRNNHINLLLYTLSVKNFVFLKSFLKFMLWSIAVPKHKFVFLWLRSVFKILVKQRVYKNIFIKIKGKLAVTGNKRTRPFYIKYGVLDSTENVVVENFTIRTTTGLLNFLIKFSY